MENLNAEMNEKSINYVQTTFSDGWIPGPWDRTAIDQPIKCVSYISTINLYNEPEIITVSIYQDRVEIIYKETSPFEGHPDKVYKMIHRCGENGLLIHEKVEGKIIPATEESYTF